MTDSLQTSHQSSTCTEAIREAVVELEDQIASENCCKTIEKSFRLCDQLDTGNDLDLANLFQTLTGNFEGVVQYNKDNRDSVGINITIDVLCDTMTDEKLGSPLQRYAAVNSMILDSTKETCLDYKYDKFLQDMRSTNWNSSAAEGGISNLSQIIFLKKKKKKLKNWKKKKFLVLTFGILQVDSGLIRRAPNSDIINHRIWTGSLSANVSPSNFPFGSVATSSVRNSTTSCLNKP